MSVNKAAIRMRIGVLRSIATKDPVILDFLNRSNSHVRQ
jgi:hypothetical protein